MSSANKVRYPHKNLIFLFTIAVIVGFLLWNSSRSRPIASRDNSPQSTSNKQANSGSNDRPVLTIGDVDAPVTITEFGDYKCPSCAAFHQGAEKQITDQYIKDGKAKIVFKTYPYLGPDSGRAARGAYCANDQSAFAAYHAAVYDYMWNTYYKAKKYETEIQDVLTLDRLTMLAVSAGANADKFGSCMADTKYNALIDEDLASAADNEVQGTPTFLIGDQKVVGPQPFNVFKSLIEIQLR